MDPIRIMVATTSASSVDKSDSIRISKGERYTTDFESTIDFQPDDIAVLIYSAKSVDGDKVRGLTGHGNDGWVKRLCKAMDCGA